jgi:hypothetical protein
VPSCCSRFAVRNAALMVYATHAQRRPEVGGYSFTFRCVQGNSYLDNRITLQ